MEPKNGMFAGIAGCPPPGAGSNVTLAMQNAEWGKNMHDSFNGLAGFEPQSLFGYYSSLHYV